MDLWRVGVHRLSYWNTCRVYEALEEGVRMDTVYLDLAKAFDKVGHYINGKDSKK